MPVQKFVSTEKHNIDGATHVGDNNRVFFDIATKTFRLGDSIKVMVARADLDERIVDFDLV